MCGIFGFIGKPTKKTIQALYLLGKFNEARGKDSAGMVVSNGKEYRFHKNIITAQKFLEDPKTIQLIGKYKRGTLMNFIGHTRQAVIGAISQKNAHPFRIGRFIFAHNGIIHNFNQLQTECKTNYEVDSQIIGYLLNIFSPVEVFEKILSGWFTVPFFELEKQNELYIAKHNTPLALAVLQDGNGMYYSSLKSDLKQTLNITGIRAGVGETNSSKIYHFKWENGKLTRDKIKIYNSNVSYTPDFVESYSHPNYTYKGNTCNSPKKTSKALTIYEGRSNGRMRLVDGVLQ